MNIEGEEKNNEVSNELSKWAFFFCDEEFRSFSNALLFDVFYLSKKILLKVVVTIAFAIRYFILSIIKQNQ